MSFQTGSGSSQKHQAWEERRRVLEDSFFLQRDQELLRQLRQQRQTERAREELSEACGIRDEAILDHFMAARIDSETITALALVPLVLVAWADGGIDDREREAVLNASTAEGIAPGSLCYQLLERWLERPPQQSQLYEAWKDYMHVVREQFHEEAFESLRQDVLGRANTVARAAGGMLGVHTVSKAEREAMQRLEAAFAS